MSLRRCQQTTRFKRRLAFDKINIKLLINLLFRCSSRLRDAVVFRVHSILGRDALVFRVHSEHAFDCIQGHHLCVTAFPLA